MSSCQGVRKRVSVIATSGRLSKVVNHTGSDFDAVLTGAGISMSMPSHLPSGDELSQRLWEFITLTERDRSSTLDQILAKAGTALSSQGTGLRLEMLAQLLSEQLPLDQLVQIYQLVDLPDAMPNLNHFAFAELPFGQHFTVNMDTLLERAGVRDVVHLHGRADKPLTIITTISQYISQLPSHISDEFGRAIGGRRLLIAGYSGRDFDVFPLLARYRPSSIVWIQHPDGDLEDEVRQGLDTLRPKTEVNVLTVRLEDYLSLHLAERGLPRPDVPLLASGSDSYSRKMSELTETFRYLDGTGKQLAIGRVLLEIGLLEETVAYLKSCEMGSLGQQSANKLSARALRRCGDPKAALSNLLEVPRGLNPLKVWVQNLNELAAVLPRAGYRRSGGALDRTFMLAGMISPNERTQRRGIQATIRLAQRQAYAARNRRSERLFNRIERIEGLEGIIDLDGMTNLLTQHADILKVNGRFDDALALCNRATNYIPYSNRSQQAFALWRHAEVLLLMGQLELAQETLEGALRLARESRDELPLGWILMTLADSYRGRDDAKEDQCLNDLQSFLGSPDLLLRSSAYLQFAESARTRGNPVGAIGILSGDESRMKSLNHIFDAFPLVKLAAQFIGITAEAEIGITGHNALVARCEMLRLRYATLGAWECAEMVGVFGRKELDGRLFRISKRCKYADWTWVEQRATSAEWDFRMPWHIVI